MAKFEVCVVESSAAPAFGVNGERVIVAHFRIHSHSGDCYEYEGSGHGAEYNERCERLKRAPTIVEAPEPTEYDPERWKQDVVRRAMGQVIAL